MQLPRSTPVLTLVLGVALGALLGPASRSAEAAGRGADEVVSIAVGRGNVIYRAWKSGRVDVCPDDGSVGELCRGRASEGK